MLDRLRLYLASYTDGHPLGLFRMTFGLLMVYEMYDYIQIQLVKNMFVLPKLNFKYDGLNWLRPMPEPYMNGLVYGLLILAILMTLGIWFRWAARFFAAGYAYLFFLDKSLYNNHIYLFILLALLLSVTDANQFLSLGKRRVKMIQRWQPFIIQLQLVIVYFYAALIKFKYDWLVRLEPARTITKAVPNGTWWASLVKNDFFLYFITYGGLAIDLLSPWLLWYKPIRRFGVPLFIGFHLTNSRLFDDIGIFPYAMMCGLVIFFDAKDLPILRGLVQADTNVKLPDSTPIYKVLQIGLTSYFVFQLLFPLRGYFLPNQQDWTTIGNRFSWRVKADTRRVVEFSFQITDLAGQTVQINPNELINTHQMNMLITDPRSLVVLAQYVEQAMGRQNRTVSAIRARVVLEYNGKQRQFFVDPNADLTKVHYTPFEVLPWVVWEEG